MAMINGTAKILDFFLMRLKFLWIWYSTNKHQQYPMMPELAEEIVFEIYCKIWKIKPGRASMIKLSVSLIVAIKVTISIKLYAFSSNWFVWAIRIRYNNKKSTKNAPVPFATSISGMLIIINSVSLWLVILIIILFIRTCKWEIGSYVN